MSVIGVEAHPTGPTLTTVITINYILAVVILIIS